jgi:hypothetical protein
VDLTKTVTTTTEDGDEPDVQQEDLSKVFIGKVPIMLRSAYCSLYDHTDKELAELGECPYDQVPSPYPPHTVSELCAVRNSARCRFSARNPNSSFEKARLCVARQLLTASCVRWVTGGVLRDQRQREVSHRAGEDVKQPRLRV